MVNSQALIGGCDRAFMKYTSTNKLLSLREGQFRESWLDVFPPIPTE